MSLRGREGGAGWIGGPLKMMKDSLLLLISNVLIRNRESNYFSWWAPQETVDYFKTLWNLLFRNFFFNPKMVKLMI